MKRLLLAFTTAWMLPTASAQATLIVPAVGGTVLRDGNVVVPGARDIGFTFNFFGVGQTNVWVNKHGHLTFGTGEDGLPNRPFPYANVFGNQPVMIAPFWDDLDLSMGEMREVTGTGFYAAIWNGVGFFGLPFLGTVTFEAVLVGAGNPFGLAPNTIVFGYGTMDGNDGSATVGLNLGNGVAFATLNGLGIGLAGGLLTHAQAVGLSDDTYCFAPTPDGYVATACTPAAIPEPATLTLVGAGVLSMALRRRSMSCRSARSFP